MADELLVQFRAGVTPADRRRVVEELGCAWREEISPQRIVVVRLPAEGAAGSELMKRFLERPEVVHVEPNGEASLPERGDLR